MSAADSQVEPKKMITELKVPELKAELEKRGLDKGGVKATLIERLEKALLDEGLDPNTYSFNLLETTLPGGTPLKKQLRNTSMDGATPTDKSADCIKEEPMDIIMLDNTAVEVQRKPVLEQAEAAESADMPAHAKNFTPAPITTEKEGEEIIIEEDEEVDQQDGSEKIRDEPMQQTAEEVIKERGDTEKSSRTNSLPPKSIDPAVPSVTATTTADLKKKTGAAGTDKNGDADLAASMWIKGISNATKAADLKMLFSKCGKVVAAKIFTTKNKLSPSCFGYVTMQNVAMAEICQQKLNRTNLKGKLIIVEKATRSLLPQINKAGKPQASKPTAPATSTSVAVQPSAVEQQLAKPQTTMSTDREGSPEVIIESVTPVTKRPLVKAATNGGVKKTEEIAPKSRIISTKSTKKITPPSKGSDSPTTASNKSTSLHRSSRPLSHRFIPTTSSSTYHKLRSTTNKYALSRYNNRGGGSTGGTSFRLHTTRRPFEFSTSSSRGAGSQVRMSRLSPTLSGQSYRSHMSPDRVASHPKSSMSSWEREEMIRLMRRKEEEYRKKEEELKMERERERLRFERERLEREKLEVKQLKLTAQLANAQFAFMASGKRSSETVAEADSSRRARKGLDRLDKGHKHLSSAPLSSGYSGSSNNKYLEDRSRRDDRDKHRSRSRSHVKDGKTDYKGSSLSKFGHGNSSKQGIDQYNQQVNRFIQNTHQSSVLPKPRSDSHKPFVASDVSKPDFGGRGKGVRGNHRTLIEISPPRTSGHRSPRHSGGGSNSRGNQSSSNNNRNASTNRTPSSFGRSMLDPLANPNSAQFRTDPSYASRVGLHSSSGAGRTANEMFGGLSNAFSNTTSHLGSTRDNYRDLHSYQQNSNTPNWTSGSRAFIQSSNPTPGSTNNTWQQQQLAGAGSGVWSNSNTVGNRSSDWGNTLNTNQTQSTNQSSRYTNTYDNKHSSSSYTRRY